MDFDLSKENIQPLRGGRNVQQLTMALQAQVNRDYQMELLQQQQEFENLIRNYQGDDPLENHYNYISWVEQSYPKHEGNLLALLEHCLHLFEDDKRYTNDKRFCKLWIKYFDMHPNTLELYHMMKAKGLCVGCADLYKAWAYYYEASGDFQAANNIFEEGKRNLAQPYEELEIAHKNLIMAAGQHMIFGPDEGRLAEKRQALITLHAHRSGRVDSVRMPNNASSIVTVPPGIAMPHFNAAPVFVYRDDDNEQGAAAAEAAPASLVAAAQRQDMRKENSIKPGPWTKIPVKKRMVGTSATGGAKFTAPFTVLEDPDISDGIHLNSNHPITCLEDYSDWKVNICYPEPPNPNVIPMYPKKLVYGDPTKEYSIEELRGRRYIVRTRMLIPQVEQEILEDVEFMQESLDELKHDIFQHHSLTNQFQQKEVQHKSIQQDEHSPMVVNQEFAKSDNFPTPPKDVSCSKSLLNEQTSQSTSMQKQNMWQIGVHPGTLSYQPRDTPEQNPLLHWGKNSTNSNELNLWDTSEIPQLSTSLMVYEQPSVDLQPTVPPKGSAMKTAFKDLTAEELAETGSRGGMDIAATAQAGASQDRTEFDVTNTYSFMINLDKITASTPQNKRPVLTNHLSEDELGNTRKQLFTDAKVEKDKALSTIIEESKTYSSSSSSSGTTTKSSLFHNNNNNNTNKMSIISEEHNSYLQQNLMVNAALRSSLLGNFMDFHSNSSLGTPQETSAAGVSPMQSSPFDSPVRQIPKPAVVKPLDYGPSDPFKPSLITHLLERVSFPGPHSYGYIEIPVIQKLSVKKEEVFIGNDKYIVEKQLGKGTFGTVFKATDKTKNKCVALKIQKPANKWEFYICRELQARLAEHALRERFMDVSMGYFSDQCSILVSEFMPGGSLLDLTNLYKQKEGKTMRECLVIYFCIQMLKMVKALHEVKIIHADIKPDNFLVYILSDNTVGLQLIDFGCSIDMSLFPPNTTFTRRVTTEDFVCCEMKDGRPWNYHTDLFCVAATAHVLLFESYIKLKKQHGMWSVDKKFSRYMKVDCWNMFFSSLLNQQFAVADIESLQTMLEDTLEVLNKDSKTALPNHMRYVVNLLKNR